MRRRTPACPCSPASVRSPAAARGRIHTSVAAPTHPAPLLPLSCMLASCASTRQLLIGSSLSATVHAGTLREDGRRSAARTGNEPRALGCRSSRSFCLFRAAQVCVVTHGRLRCNRLAGLRPFHRPVSSQGPIARVGDSMPTASVRRRHCVDVCGSVDGSAWSLRTTDPN